jgi:hypothetical protein
MELERKTQIYRHLVFSFDPKPLRMQARRASSSSWDYFGFEPTALVFVQSVCIARVHASTHCTVM